MDRVKVDSGVNTGDESYNVMAPEFGAIGDGNLNALSSAEAASYNARFSAYGAQGAYALAAGDSRDYAAIQCALWKAANTGASVFIPPGDYYLSESLILNWTATPITGQPATPLVCRIYGSGRASVLKGYNIGSGRGVLELLGESNANAVNCQVEHLQFEEDPSTCNKYSACLRLGDGYVGINLNRVICKGAQSLILKVASSATYAQICFLATQCQFWSNWDLGWGPDTAGMDVYSVLPESGGSYWDSVLFQDCFFWGQVDCRAFTLKFETCIFINQVERDTPYCCTVYLGTAAWDNCYFEDYLVGIATDSITASVPITNIAIRNSHFSTANNSGTPANVQSCIQCAADQAPHGPVLIENCRFGTTATYSDIDLYGSYEALSVTVTGCCRPFGTEISTPPTITTAGDVRLVTNNPDKNATFDTMSLDGVYLEAPEQIGPVTVNQETTGQAVFDLDNPDTSNTATASVSSTTDNNSAKLISYGQNHSALPNYAIVMTSATNGPVALAPGGLVRLEADDTSVRAIRSFDGGYGFTAQQTNGGTSAYAFQYVFNGVDVGGAQLFGTGHPFAGTVYMGNFSSKPLSLRGSNVTVETALTLTDSQLYITGSGDSTKIAKFEADGITSLTTRTFTLPDANTTLAGLAVAQTFSAAQTMSSTLTLDTSSDGLTISKTTGTTLTVSSTNAAAIACSGGMTTANLVTMTAASGTMPLKIVGAASHSGSLFEIQNSSAVRGLYFELNAGGTSGRSRIGIVSPGTNQSVFLDLDANGTGGSQWRQTTGTGPMVFYNIGGAINFYATSTNILNLTSTQVSIVPTTGTTLTVSSTDTSASVSLSGGQTIATSKNLRMGTAAIATNATDGFIYASTCAGTPTGTPTTLTGTAPIVIDTTNHKLYFYSGGSWRDAGP